MESKKRRGSLAERVGHVETRGAEIIRHEFRAVESAPCQETIAHLRLLLDEAERGDLRGIAWVAMYRNRQWDRALTGEAQRNRTWTLGMLHAYCASLAEDLNS